MNRYNVIFLAIILVVAKINGGEVAETPSSVPAIKELCSIIWHQNPSKDEFEKLLADKSVDPNSTSFECGADWDPLSAVIFEGRFDLVEPLMSAGADPKKTLYPPIGFMAALHYGYTGCCRNAGKLKYHQPFCFSIRAEANKIDPEEDRHDSFEAALACLIKAKADVDGQMDDLPTAAVMAFEGGDIKTGNMLVEKGANLEFVVTKVVSANDVRAVLKKRSALLKNKRLESTPTF